MQSCILTEVIDCGALIVVTSSNFLKRKDMLKEKKAVSQESKPAAQHIYRQMYFVHPNDLHVYCALVNLDTSGPPGVRPTPGLRSSTQCVCVRAYVCVYARIQAHTHPPP